MSLMTVIYTLSVWLHILAASVWVGGMGFLVLVIVPQLRASPGNLPGNAALVHTLAMRFRKVGWGALWVLLLTGLINMAFRGLLTIDLFTPAGWENPIIRAMGVKLALVAAMMGWSAWHDYRVGPRATAVMQAAPDSARAMQMRRTAGRMGRITALLSLIIVWVAVRLVRGGF